MELMLIGFQEQHHITYHRQCEITLFLSEGIIINNRLKGCFSLAGYVPLVQTGLVNIIDIDKMKSV